MMRALLLSFALLSGGCASTIVPKPGDITLENALKSVGEGLSQMQFARYQSLREALADWQRTKSHYITLEEIEPFLSGLYPSEVTVAFNISAKATDTASAKLYIEAGATPAADLAVGKAGAEASIGTTVVAMRGNTVTIKFLNVLFAPEKSLVGLKSPEELHRLLEVVRAQFKPAAVTN